MLPNRSAPGAPSTSRPLFLLLRTTRSSRTSSLMRPILVLACSIALFSSSALAASGDVNTAVTADGEKINMGYIPSYALNGVGLALWFLTTVAMWLCFFRTIGRKPLYMLCLCISLCCMTIAIILRFAYRQDLSGKGIYIVQYLFVILTPCGFLASNYVLLGRLAQAMGHEAVQCLFIPAHHVATIFVWSDIITLCLQAAGGGLTASDKLSSIQTGKKIFLAGLGIQLASFLLFSCLLIIFLYKTLTRIPKFARPAQPFQWREYRFWSNERVYDWRPFGIVLAVTCIGILVRSVFRIVEYSEGYYGPLATGEGYLYGLDMLPLWLSMTAFVFFFPPRFIEAARELNRNSLEPVMRNGDAPEYGQVGSTDKNAAGGKTEMNQF